MCRKDKSVFAVAAVIDKCGWVGAGQGGRGESTDDGIGIIK